MEQQQIKVSFSVGSKLLISVVLLLFIVILFLNISSILLFREDKKAYTYQAQSTEALLTGKGFVTIARHAIDSLRTSLAIVDPRGPVSPTQITALQSLIDNQTEIFTNSIYLLDTKTGVIAPYVSSSRQKDLQAIDLNIQDYTLTSELLLPLVPQLMEKAFNFVNLSKLGGPPILAAIFADVHLKLPSGQIPIAVGLLSLKGFGEDVNRIALTIANRSGAILYDSDPTEFYSKRNVLDNQLFKAAVTSQLANGAQEFDQDDVHYLGSYILLDYDLIVLTKVEWQKAMRATYMLIEKFILLGSMAVSAAIVFAILFSKTLTAPIERLYDATKEVAKGNFMLQLPETGRDELGALSGSFNSMSKKIAELVEESIKKVQLENEIAIASTVQQTLIPPDDFKNPWLHIFSHYRAASQCGGDWWGFFGVDNKLAIMIADATGHGFPSALITASARSCFSVLHKLAQEDPEFSFSPSAMLSYANRVIYDASLGKIMMTFFVGVIDFDAKMLSYSSAGHNPPWLFKKEGDKYTLKSLTAVGQRLGETRESPNLKKRAYPLLKMT